VRRIHLIVLGFSLSTSISLPAAGDITSIDPDLVLPASALGIGGTPVSVNGRGFADTHEVRVGGKPLLSQRFVSEARITGRIPNLTPGFYDVTILGARGLLEDTLPRAVEVTGPVTLTSVTPNALSREGGTQVTVNGTNFRDATMIRFGAHALLSPSINRTGTAITGLAPALDAGEPDGPYDVTASDSRGLVRLTNGVTYSAPFELTMVEPQLVSTAGGTAVTFIGTGFKASATIKLGGKLCTSIRFVDAQHVTGVSPALSAGFHDAEISLAAALPLIRGLPKAVEAAPPPAVREVVPKDVSGLAATPVEIRGANFRPQTNVRFASHEILDLQVVDADTILGKTPPLSVGETLGLKDVFAFDSRGTGELKQGVNYVAPPTITLDSVIPFLISTQGNQTVTFRGSGFQAGDVPSIDGKDLTEVSFKFSTELTGKTPGLDPGFHKAQVTRRGGPSSPELPRAVEAAPPPVVRAVSPNQVSTEGGTQVVIAGANFRPVTMFKLGNLELLNPEVAPDGSAVEGQAPPSQTAGAKDVTAEDTRGKSTLGGGVTYVEPARRTLPPPIVTDTALAYRMARFEWENLADYDEIHVLDGNGNFIEKLPKGTRTYMASTGGATSLTRQFKGFKTEFGFSQGTLGIAKVHQCIIPPPLIGLAEPGDLEFTLFGGHSESGDDGCAGGGGGGALTEFAYPQNGLGHLQAQNGTGYILQGTAALDINPGLFKLIDSNKLTTGFTLATDADKLEIQLFARKIGVSAGLELRGRLIHVFPDDGFKDEFTFPSTLLKPTKEWQKVIYNRSFIDGDGVRQPCEDAEGNLKKIPAGEYLLDFYAVGGNPKLPYFYVADDPLDIELLIKGSPCPPYPAVKVTDLTGFRTVPQICGIEPEIATYPGDLFALTVHFHAQGVWSDFDNTEYRIHQNAQLCKDAFGDPITITAALKNSPDFKYEWAIYKKDETPVYRTSGNSPILYYEILPDWGCYKVELTVRDKKCGLESKYSKEVAIFPPSISCTGNHVKPSTPANTQITMKSSYFFPTPDPKNIFGVVGLKNPTPGTGKFEGERPVEFRVLVVPCHCGTTNNQIKNCPAPLLNDPDDPNDDDIQFRLAIKNANGTYTGLSGAKIKVTDPCAEVVQGPKYLFVRIDDIAEIGYEPALGQFQFKSVYFQARNRFITILNPNQTTTTLPGDPSGYWKNIGSPLRLSNRPDSLATSYWNGHFEPGDTSYHFIAKSSPNTEEQTSLGASNEMPIDVPDVDAGVPSYEDNDVNTGFTSRYLALKGNWENEDATGGMSGNTMGNDLKGEPMQVLGEAKYPVGGGIIDPASVYYEWSKIQKIFKQKFSTTIFEAVIYTGTIGPVPITIWGSIGLGLDFAIEAAACVKVAPFKALLQGGNFVETYFDVFSQVTISIPCEIRADILGGLASIAMRLRPEAVFTLIPYFEMKLPNQPVPTVDFFLSATFSLYFEIEVCIQTIIFGEQCINPGEIALIDHANIFPPHPNGWSAENFARPDYCEGGGGGHLLDAVSIDGGAPQGGAEAGAAGRGKGGDTFNFNAYSVAVAPVTIVSPDRKTVVDTWVQEVEGNLLQIRANQQKVKAPGFPGLSFYLIDPSASFTSNQGVLFAWLQPAYAIDPEDLPPKTDVVAYLAKINQNAATAEVMVSPMFKRPGYPAGEEWAIYDNFFDGDYLNIRIMDEVETDETTWRADGKPSIAGDLAEGDEALVAWVRYDTHDFMIQDGFRQTNVPCDPQEICLCPTANDPAHPCKFKKVTLPYFRPQMEMTAIFVRRVGFTTELTVNSGWIADADYRSQPFKLSPPGINIEPFVSTAPSGAKSYVVWLHDATHTDLISQNRGRQVLYSIYTKNAADLNDPNQWSAPQGVLPMPDDYPGLLEPKIYLKSDDDGLLVFTALDKSAPMRDTGLGVGRYLYGVRLIDGIFGEPFRVHGKCLKRQYGFSQSGSLDIPEAIDPLDKLKWKNPEWVMTFNGFGDIGSREASGNVMVTTLPEGGEAWSPPVNLTPDDNIHSNVAATVTSMGVHSIHLDGGKATFNPAAGGGGGLLDSKKSFVVMDTPLEPDPAITGCRLDFPYASPGSQVKVTVAVENAGFICTPVNKSDGTSALGIKIVLIDSNGASMTAAEGIVPELEPGQNTLVNLMVEVPLDPVRLRAELDPGPLDRDRTNNTRECFFGTPAPTNFKCEPIDFTDVDDEGNDVETLAVKLTWENQAVYDQILLYRDGCMFKGLPGACKMWIDSETSSGTHTYEIRARILVSQSQKASCMLDVVPPLPPGLFRRGDADGNGTAEITDPIVVLNYLFQGGATPRCLDAADADDNGAIEITDPIKVLNFLFLAGLEPDFPGTRRCGPDPTFDRLPACGGECR